MTSVHRQSGGGHEHFLTSGEKQKVDGFRFLFGSRPPSVRFPNYYGQAGRPASEYAIYVARNNPC